MSCYWIDFDAFSGFADFCFASFSFLWSTTSPLHLENFGLKKKRLNSAEIRTEFYSCHQRASIRLKLIF